MSATEIRKTVAGSCRQFPEINWGSEGTGLLGEGTGLLALGGPKVRA